MTQFNPIFGAALPGAIAQQQLAAQKTQHIRRQQAAARNIAATGDRLEHAVENVDIISAVSDDKPRDQKPPNKQKKRRPQSLPADEPPHVDVKA
jgi:hypothetical protein